MNRILILCMLLLPIALACQTFEEFKANQKKGVQQIQQNMDEWISQKDKEFENYLRTEWSDFNGKTRDPMYVEPKPLTTPTYSPDPKKSNKEILFVAPMRKPDIDPLLSKSIDTIGKVIVDNLSKVIVDETKDVVFFGVPIKLPDYEGICSCQINNVKKGDLASWWKEMAKTNYQPMLKSALYYKDKLNLNDWGYLKLLRFIGSKYCPTNKCQELFVWFYLNKSGYDARIAFSGEKFSLLIPVKQQLFGFTYLEINGVNYYVLNELQSNKFKTYMKGHARAKKILDFDLKESMQLGHAIKTRRQSLIFNLKTYLFAVDYNPNWVEFFKDYPQGDLNIYFNAIVSDEYKSSLKRNFTDKLSNFSQKESINFILRYVQYGFDYKTDLQQFGYEKFFFPEETLAYPYADCEDRAIYFSYLVRYLLKINVVGLQYPNHISTAVQFNEQINGSSLFFNGDRYYMADPTYIGASLGGEMYEYVNEKPVIIVTDQYSRLN